MNNKTKEQITEDISTIVNATLSVIDGMKNSDRMPIKDMAKTVGLALAIEPSKVLPFVNYVAHNTVEGRVSAGKTGGFRKQPQNKSEIITVSNNDTVI